jgi:hypothetical protein
VIGPARRREKQLIAFLAYGGVTPLDLVRG